MLAVSETERYTRKEAVLTIINQSTLPRSSKIKRSTPEKSQGRFTTTWRRSTKMELDDPSDATSLSIRREPTRSARERTTGRSTRKRSKRELVDLSIINNFDVLRRRYLDSIR